MLSFSRMVIFAGLIMAGTLPVHAQYTDGFLNLPRAEAPGTLLSHPVDNLSSNIGRTTTLNYLNGWLVVGAESPGSMDGSDLSVRVYDIEDPANPIRRHPSDFSLTYPHGDYWYVGDSGWNAHGTALHGSYLLPQPVLRVQTFGGPVELGGFDGLPGLAQFPLLYNRSSQAGPWYATMLWYGTPSQLMEIRRPRLNLSGHVNDPGDLLASFDHVGAFGGGDWHPMFFGDLLIYARSGGAANGGVVVYRLEYHDFDDPDFENHSVTPHLVAALEGGFSGYWPNLFSDGDGLYVIGSNTDILIAADITGAVDPGGDGEITQGPVLTIPGFSNATYPVYQDQFAFIHNRKINMTQFLGGQGTNAIVLTLDEASTGIDTSQMSLPLGNLWITGGTHLPNRQQGMAIWVHQQAPDTNRPYVAYHIPQANRDDYPQFAPMSFLLHEYPRHGGLRNGIDFLVRPVDADGETLGEAVSGFLIHDFSGVLTFTPADGLESNTTYQVDFPSDDSDPLNPIGFMDAAGNMIEPYHFRFATGGGVDAPAPPVFSNLIASAYQIAPATDITLTAHAAPGDLPGPLEYRFNPGDAWTVWSTNHVHVHPFNESGRYRVLAQVRDASGLILTRSVNLLVMDAPTPPYPTQSGTMAVGDDPGGRRLWVVNPDSDTVSVLDAATGEVIAEHAVGISPRSVARDAFGRYWITCHGSDEIIVMNANVTVHATIDTPYGSAPFGIAASPDGQSIFATLYGSAQLHRYQASNANAAPTVRNTFPTPRAIAISGDGQRVLVTRFISPDLEAEISEYDGLSSALNLVRTFRLASANTVDGGDRAAGVPNYLAGIAISPDGTRAAVVSKQDNVQRGLLYGVNDLTFETSVRAVISFLNLETNVERQHTRRDFDNGDSPSAVTYTPWGDTLLVTLQGNNRVVGMDAMDVQPVTGVIGQGATLTSPAVKTLEAVTGLAPQGVLLDAVTQRVFVQNFMERSVTMLDAQPLLEENRTTLSTLVTTNTVGVELLELDVLLGKQIFYNASDPRMSADTYISCATCHIDGGHDGRAWDFTGRGEGLRRTTDLRGRGGLAHGNVHWSGNFDEIQDFEHDIRGSFGGSGFLPLTPAEFNAQHPSPASVKAGLNADLDALTAYVSSLAAASVPRSPHRQSDGSMTAAGVRGREVFSSLSCMACHQGAAFTDSVVAPVQTMPLQAVGTTSTLSGQRSGGSLSGIDTPTLIGLHASRRYLHHGEATTLSNVFSYAGGTLLYAADADRIGGPAVYVEQDLPGQGGGGFLRGALGGALVHITGSNGNGVRFLNVDGGAGGTARIGIRYSRRYGDQTARLRVNGVEQSAIPLLRQYPDNGWMISGWRWHTTMIDLGPGATNIIEVLRNADMYSDFELNAVLVANADDLAAADPHLVASTVSADDFNDLLAYLRQLDGSAGDAPVPLDENNVDVTLSLADGYDDPLTSPFVDVDVQFSGAVSGLTAGMFDVGGVGSGSARHLTDVMPGLQYRLRLAGYASNGVITVALPGGVVDTVPTGHVNNASAILNIPYQTPVRNDLALLSDEFDDAASQADWFNNDEVEGWQAYKLETWDINDSMAGQMRLMPYASSFYQDFTGAYVFREIEGDFVLTIRLHVRSRHGAHRPNSDFSLAGIMIRTPRGITQGAAVPHVGSDTVLPWPPPALEEPNHYVTDWLPGTENYIFLSYGFAHSSIAWPDGANTNRWQYEVKTTSNGVSTLYPRTFEVPEHEPEATLQVVRRSSTFLLLRRHGDGPWIIENRFERSDMPDTLQVGVTAYTDWNTVSAGWDFASAVQPYHHNRIVYTNTSATSPDLIADVNYFRLRRPDAVLDQAALQAVLVTGPDGPVQWLADTAWTNMLGDAASTHLPDAGYTYAQWLGEQMTPSELVDPALTDPAADAGGHGFPNALSFVLGRTLLDDALWPGPADLFFDEGAVRLLVPRNPHARGWSVSVDTSTNLLSGWSSVAVSEDGATPLGVGVYGEIPGDPPWMIIGPAEAHEDAPMLHFRTRAAPLP